MMLPGGANEPLHRVILDELAADYVLAGEVLHPTCALVSGEEWIVRWRDYSPRMFSLCTERSRERGHSNNGS